MSRRAHHSAPPSLKILESTSSGEKKLFSHLRLGLESKIYFSVFGTGICTHLISPMPATRPVRLNLQFYQFNYIKKEVKFTINFPVQFSYFCGYLQPNYKGHLCFQTQLNPFPSSLTYDQVSHQCKRCTTFRGLHCMTPWKLRRTHASIFRVKF